MLGATGVIGLTANTAFAQDNGEEATKLDRIEVTGSRTNVELADYVANFLDQELERLFSVYQKEHSDLKGQRAKNSFFKGMAEGYVEKIKKTQKEVSLAEGKELIVLEVNAS